MRYGFVYGIGGDERALGRALATLRDCDRIVSLGNLLGGASPEDRAVWERFEALGPRGIALAGPGERLRAKDPSFPRELRFLLRGLSSSTIEDGIAILGEPAASSSRGSRRENTATGGAPRLVAPLTVTSHGGDSRLWRSAGGLARISEIAAAAPVDLAAERFWLELGRTAAGVPTCAVVDLERGVLELRVLELRDLELRDLELGDFTPVAPSLATEPRVRARRRRPLDERQGLLAV